MARMIVFAVLAGAIGGCLDPELTDGLVPATVDADPDLPQVTIEIDGHERGLHLEEFGDPDAPPLFMLHGAFADYRGLRPLAVALSDRYHVVAWDQRGAGLSERIGDGEFSFDSAVEEIEILRQRHAGGQPVTLIGHSWGGGLATLYVSAFPDSVRQVVLLEPMGFDSAVMNEQEPHVVQFKYLDEGWNEQARLNRLLGPSDHARLDFRALLTHHSGLTNYFCDRDNPTEVPVWRVGGYLEFLRNAVLQGDGGGYAYDVVPGIDAFEEEILILGGECGGLGFSFQQTNAELLPSARVVEIEDAGHWLFVEQPEQVLEAVRDYLEEYP